MFAARGLRKVHGARILWKKTAILITEKLPQAARQLVFAILDAVTTVRKDYAWKILLKEYAMIIMEPGWKTMSAIFLNATLAAVF